MDGLLFGQIDSVFLSAAPAAWFGFLGWAAFMDAGLAAFYPLSDSCVLGGYLRACNWACVLLSRVCGGS
jgi:hypothetical protein